MYRKGLVLTFIALLFTLRAPAPAWAAAPWGLDQALAPERLSSSLMIFLAITALSLAPALVVMVTSFTRLVVVFSFLRHALGTQTMPPNQVLIALSLFLTVFIMAPVWQDIKTAAVQPYIDQQLSRRRGRRTGPPAVKDLHEQSDQGKGSGPFPFHHEGPQT